MHLTSTVTGANIATSGTSARVAIPVASSGEIPRYIRVSATAAAHIRVGASTVTAVATDILVQPGDAVRLALAGQTHIAAIQDAVGGTVNIAPLEDC